MSISLKLEICAADIESIDAAAKGGADRIELCSGLECGGISPSLGMLDYALSTPGILTNVLLRTRSGDFLYSQTDKEVMWRDAEVCGKCGANGIVIGSLNADGSIDVPFVKRMVEIADGTMEVTFHRAFDVCRNPEESIRQLIDLGVTRILTSGCAPSAYKGMNTLASLIASFGNQISIMPGAGVNAANVREIIETTHAGEIHASAKMKVLSGMTYRNPDVNMGTGDVDEYVRFSSSWQEVAQLRTILNEIM